MYDCLIIKIDKTDVHVIIDRIKLIKYCVSSFILLFGHKLLVFFKVYITVRS